MARRSRSSSSTPSSGSIARTAFVTAGRLEAPRAPAGPRGAPLHSTHCRAARRPHGIDPSRQPPPWQLRSRVASSSGSLRPDGGRAAALPLRLRDARRQSRRIRSVPADRVTSRRDGTTADGLRIGCGPQPNRDGPGPSLLPNGPHPGPAGGCVTSVSSSNRSNAVRRLPGITSSNIASDWRYH